MRWRPHRSPGAPCPYRQQSRCRPASASSAFVGSASPMIASARRERGRTMGLVVRLQAGCGVQTSSSIGSFCNSCSVASQVHAIEVKLGCFPDSNLMCCAVMVETYSWTGAPPCSSSSPPGLSETESVRDPARVVARDAGRGRARFRSAVEARNDPSASTAPERACQWMGWLLSTASACRRIASLLVPEVPGRSAAGGRVGGFRWRGRLAERRRL